MRVDIKVMKQMLGVFFDRKARVTQSPRVICREGRIV